jgi:uncharacterized membrane protein
MAKLFSIRPPLSFRGRKFKGLRGWSGKPLHPPLTDFPIVAYVLAAVFDVISYVAAYATTRRRAPTAAWPTTSLWPRPT